MKIILIYFLLFMTYSFIGWCIEVGVKFFYDHKFVNRGFLIGPYCPIYGCGVVLMQILLARYLQDPITLFIMIFLTCSILEYFTSFILEKLFHTRWWDYSNKRFNINGRICLSTMIPFSIFGMFIMYKANPFFLNLFASIPNNWLIIISAVLFIIIFTDFIVSFRIINSIKNVSKETQQKQIIKRDDTERITELVRKRIIKSQKRLQKRILDAFPDLEMLKWKKKKKK